MRTWDGWNWYVMEKKFDHDLHQFYVYRKTKDGRALVGQIVPVNIDDMNKIIRDLDAGQSPDGWEDGTGDTITI